jgi:hypothetical protein
MLPYYHMLNAFRYTLVNTKYNMRNILTPNRKYGKFMLVLFYLLLGDIFNEAENNFSL